MNKRLWRSLVMGLPAIVGLWGGQSELAAAYVGGCVAFFTVEWIADRLSQSATVADATTGPFYQKSLDSTERFLRLVDAEEAGNLGCWEIDAEMGLHPSSQLMQIMGFPGLTFKGSLDSLRPLLLAEDWAIVSEAKKRMLAGGELGVADLHLRIGAGELRIFRFSGNVERDEKGKFLRCMGVTQDITRQRDAEERHRIISGTVQEAVGRFSEEGVCIYMSSAGARLFDCPRKELVGARLADLLQPEYRSYVSLLYREILGGQRTQASVDVRIRRPKSSPVWVELRLTSWTAPGEVLIAWRDVDEEKKWEERFFQSQKMEAIGRLAGGVAHDFNNLLQVILGNLELVCLGLPNNSPERPVLAEVQQAGRRAAELTGKLLTFSRRDGVQLRPVDIHQAVRDIQTLISRLIGEDVHIQLTLHDSTERVMADPLGVQQILLNLAVNARDAMPGGGDLRISTGRETRTPQGRDGDFVTLTVADSGDGIDAEVRPYIFEPFFTTKPLGQGTGLGLATVYGLVHQWEGEIAVESQKGQGTTFRIYLPVSNVAVPLDDEARPTDHVNQAVTILLVEDEDAVRRQISQSLKRQGHAVQEASDGESALQMPAGTPTPDLLITDVVLPHVNGHELAVKLQERYPSLKVLYITGYAEDWLTRTGLSASQLPILRKPFTLQELDGKIGELLNV